MWRFACIDGLEPRVVLIAGTIVSISDCSSVVLLLLRIILPVTVRA